MHIDILNRSKRHAEDIKWTKTFFFDFFFFLIQVILSQNWTGLNLLTLIYANLCHWEKSMTSYPKIEWRYSFAPVESGGRAKNLSYMQNFSFIAPWLQRAVFQYLLNLLCACVQHSASIFRADESFSWFGFQSWPNLPNFEVICVENTQLCSKNLFFAY